MKNHRNRDKMYTTNTFIHEYLNHRNRDKMYTPNTFIHEYLIFLAWYRT